MLSIIPIVFFLFFFFLFFSFFFLFLFLSFFPCFCSLCEWDRILGASLYSLCLFFSTFKFIQIAAGRTRRWGQLHMHPSIHPSLVHPLPIHPLLLHFALNPRARLHNL